MWSFKLGLRIEIMKNQVLLYPPYGTGETYMSLQYHWLVAEPQNVNSSPRSARTSLMNYVHPLRGGHIIFAFSGVCRRASAIRRHTWFPVISRKSIYPIFTKFGMGVYRVNSLHGIAFGEDSSIAN